MHLEVRKRDVDTVARLSSKGQVTVPKAVREALGVADDEDVRHGD